MTRDPKQTAREVEAKVAACSRCQLPIFEGQSFLVIEGKAMHAPDKCITLLRSELQQARELAAKWDALMGCGRVRLLGCAGLDDPASEYAHIGFELWTLYAAPEGMEERLADENIVGKQRLDEFANKAIALATGGTNG